MSRSSRREKTLILCKAFYAGRDLSLLTSTPTNGCPETRWGIAPTRLAGRWLRWARVPSANNRADGQDSDVG